MSKHNQKINKEVYDDYRKSGFHLSVDMMINLAISKTAKAIFEDLDSIINNPNNLGLVDNLLVEYEAERKKWVGEE